MSRRQVDPERQHLRRRLRRLPALRIDGSGVRGGPKPWKLASLPRLERSRDRNAAVVRAEHGSARSLTDERQRLALGRPANRYAHAHPCERGKLDLERGSTWIEVLEPRIKRKTRDVLGGSGRGHLQKQSGRVAALRDAHATFTAPCTAVSALGALVDT